MVLANKGCGVGIPILRMFHFSVIKSLIDYAATFLFQFFVTQLRSLELVQNETMRIIFGCPRMAKIEGLIAELGLSSIVTKIQEVACRSTCV